jgi:uncharacterized protein (DUF2062 family)
VVKKFKKRFIEVLTGHASPGQIAFAISTGIIVGLNPFFLPFQTGICLAIAFPLKINKPGIILGSLLPLPLIFPFAFFASLLGGMLTGNKNIITMQKISQSFADLRFQNFAQMCSEYGIKGLGYPFVSLWHNTKWFIGHFFLGYFVAGIFIFIVTFCIFRFLAKKLQKQEKYKSNEA